MLIVTCIRNRYATVRVERIPACAKTSLVWGKKVPGECDASITGICVGKERPGEIGETGVNQPPVKAGVYPGKIIYFTLLVEVGQLDIDRI